MPVSAAIWASRLVIAVAFLDLFIQFPIVAPFARALGASPALAGAIVGIYSATNLAGNLLAGVAVDRWGRRRPILAGLVVTALALFGYAIVQTPEQLLRLRALHGFAAAILTPGAFALIGDLAAPDLRARAMGINGAIIAVTAVIGPPLAGVMRDRWNVGAPFLLGGALMIIATLIFAAVVRERDFAVGVPMTQAPMGRYLERWFRPALLDAYLAALALTIGLGTLVTHLPLLLTARGESAGRAGLAFTIYAAVAMVLMASPTNRLSDRYGRLGPVASGIGLLAAGLLVLGLAPGMAGVGAGMAIFGLGFGLLFPAATALIADATTPWERGAAFGLFYAVYSLGVVIGSFLSGIIDDWLGEIGPGPFLVAAAVAALIAPTILLIRRRAVAPV
jgi:DHA1 family multidrug resistance protein-like MFS transporter